MQYTHIDIYAENAYNLFIKLEMGGYMEDVPVELSNLYYRELQAFKKQFYGEIVAFGIAKYYEIFGNSSESLFQIVNSILEGEYYNERDTADLTNEACELLNSKYNMDIIKTTPLVIKCCII